MKLVQLAALKQRKSNDSQHGSRSIVAFDRQSAREVKSAERGSTNQRADSGTLRLGHVHLKVRTLIRSMPFYTETLGLRLSEQIGRYAFFATKDEHHSIALEEVGESAMNPPRCAVGVAHVAFQAPDREAFTAMRKKLSERNCPFISRDNGISWAIRFKDPDGNEIEVYVDRRYSPGGTQLWGGRWHRPLHRAGTHPLTTAAALVA